MILDIADLADGQELSADLCIVGAGAAGIALALKLMNRGLDVLVVESGGHRHEDDVQDLYAGSVADPTLHAPTDRFRCSQLGGSTTLWGGRCVPFDAIDFEKRSYVAHSGWPITLDELLPYYREANRLCEAGAFAYQIDEAFGRPMKPMIEGFESSAFSTDCIERFSKPSNFAERYGPELEAARNVRVLLHATATQFSSDDSGRTLSRLTLRSLRGRSVTVQARAFVLAAGGLEVARLLLANRTLHPDGIGNQHGVVGRYYMCHIAGTIGRIKIDRPNSAVWHDYDVADDGTYCRRRFALLSEAQRQHRIGNFVARLHHPQIGDPAHRTAALSLVFLGSRLLPWEYRIRVAGSDGASLGHYAHHFTNVMLDPQSAVRFAYRMVTGRFLARRKIPSLVVKTKANLFSLDFHAEQVPNPESRIGLGNETDALGIPRIHVDWRYSPQDVATVAKSVELLASDFKSSGAGTLSYDPGTIEAEMTRYGAYGGHHVGTARMGDDPRSSVVDRNCRVHGVDNLYIASAATFPTSSQANPTLTIVALTLRLAEHLQGKLQLTRSSSDKKAVIAEIGIGGRDSASFGAENLLSKQLAQH
ncbi:MAG: GMC family oxidoreductase [Hyphomicrobium sp.]|nr:GMC family oxidoreductase [Hyphomicrobium sp.]